MQRRDPAIRLDDYRRDEFTQTSAEGVEVGGQFIGVNPFRLQMNEIGIDEIELHEKAFARLCLRFGSRERGIGHLDGVGLGTGQPLAGASTVDAACLLNPSDTDAEIEITFSSRIANRQARTG